MSGDFNFGDGGFFFFGDTSSGSFGSFIFFLFVLIVFCASLSYCTPKDDTDPVDGVSGLSLSTDAGTGCQYLERGDALTPRLDANGKQICKEEWKRK